LPSTIVQKQTFRDPASRILKLVDQLELRYRRLFVQMVRAARADLPVARLERLIVGGRQEQAFQVLTTHVTRMADQINLGFIHAGTETAAFLGNKFPISFDLTNHRAVRAMQQNKLKFVREFMVDQRQATRTALVEGITQGLNPRAQARMFRDSIGLTSRQEAAVQNYGRLLREGNKEALTRALRDRRFDRTVSTSIRDGKPLTDGQVGRMVTRYRERYLKYRSETIARTEALASAHEGTEELYRQAIDSGAFSAEEIGATWHTSVDGRERDSHRAMDGQTQPHGEPFVSGEGNLLRYPGDRDAPAEEVIQCRCAVSRNVKET
jgi:hypothetical protein